MKKLRLPVLSIILYVLTGVIAAYTIWSYVHCYNYISELISSGQITFSGSEYDIISFFMSNCVQYLVYTAILFTLARLAHRRVPWKQEAEVSDGIKTDEPTVIEETETEDKPADKQEDKKEDNPEDWFEN